jgi:hypothetical protein
MRCPGTLLLFSTRSQLSNMSNFLQIAGGNFLQSCVDHDREAKQSALRRFVNATNFSDVPTSEKKYVRTEEEREPHSGTAQSYVNHAMARTPEELELT